eukprot:6208785-Pleurochrysis_carterae.AAC.1
MSKVVYNYSQMRAASMPASAASGSTQDARIRQKMDRPVDSKPYFEVCPNRKCSQMRENACDTYTETRSSTTNRALPIADLSMPGTRPCLESELHLNGQVRNSHK